MSVWQHVLGNKKRPSIHFDEPKQEMTILYYTCDFFATFSAVNSSLLSGVKSSRERPQPAQISMHIFGVILRDVIHVGSSQKLLFGNEVRP